MRSARMLWTTRGCWPKSGKLTMPVLALGGEKSFGTGEADDLRFVAANVTSGYRAQAPAIGSWRKILWPLSDWLASS